MAFGAILKAILALFESKWKNAIKPIIIAAC
jgi:hypothetical protein